MPRTLPWLAQDKLSAFKQPSSSSPAPLAKRKRAPSPSEDLVDSDLNPVSTPARRARQQLARSPSTSPAPAPPEVGYMREGYNADDIWMMVEDEFFSTAQSFTQHIHHAEYVRLKNLAKARGEGTLQGIARPTDGRTAQGIGAKVTAEAAEKARWAKKGLDGLEEESNSDDGEEDDFMFDPNLAGLMSGSQKSWQDLTKMAKTKANTRAAAGFGQSPRKPKPTAPVVQARDCEEDDDEGSDDLDCQPRWVHKKATSESSTKMQGQSSDVKRLATGDQAKHRTSSFFKDFSGPQPKKTDRSPTGRSIAPTSSSSDHRKNAGEDSLMDAHAQRSQASTEFLAKRRAARDAAKQKSEKDQGKAKRSIDVDIPTFAVI